MKLLIEYAGDIDDKETGIKTIEVEFEKDSNLLIKIGENERINIFSTDGSKIPGMITIDELKADT